MDDVTAFGLRVVDALRSRLGDDLVGAWFVGSVALGGYVHGESDVDIVAVCKGGIADDVRRALTDAVLPVTADCPARGLELTLYRRDIVSAPPVGADFELNVNGGPRMEVSVHDTPEGEQPFWYVLDRAIAHRVGVVIDGPPARDVFADAPRSMLLGAMHDSMRWHRAHERATLYSVLNAARAWRFAAEDVLGSKLEGAAWARARWRNPALIDAAVDLRHGRPAELDEQAVDDLLDHVEHVLADVASYRQR